MNRVLSASLTSRTARPIDTRSRRRRPSASFFVVCPRGGSKGEMCAVFPGGFDYNHLVLKAPYEVDHLFDGFGLSGGGGAVCPER